MIICINLFKKPLNVEILRLFSCLEHALFLLLVEKFRMNSEKYITFAPGGMAERSNAAVLKTVVLLPRDRGFESLFLRKIIGNQMQNPVN